MNGILKSQRHNFTLKSFIPPLGITKTHIQFESPRVKLLMHPDVFKVNFRVRFQKGFTSPVVEMIKKKIKNALLALIWLI